MQMIESFEERIAELEILLSEAKSKINSTARPPKLESTPTRGDNSGTLHEQEVLDRSISIQILMEQTRALRSRIAGLTAANKKANTKIVELQFRSKRLEERNRELAVQSKMSEASRLRPVTGNVVPTTQNVRIFLDLNRYLIIQSASEGEIQSLHRIIAELSNVSERAQEDLTQTRELLAATEDELELLKKEQLQSNLLSSTPTDTGMPRSISMFGELESYLASRTPSTSNTPVGLSPLTSMNRIKTDSKLIDTLNEVKRRIHDADTVNLNRSLRKTFDISYITRLSNKILDEIIETVKGLETSEIDEAIFLFLRGFLQDHLNLKKDMNMVALSYVLIGWSKELNW